MQEAFKNGLRFHFEYEGSGPGARCVHTWGDGGIYDHRLAYDVAAGRTAVTNSLGHATTYFGNENGLVAEKHDARGGVTRQRQYSWRGADRLTEIADSLTGPTRFDYNAFGNLTASEYADGTTELRLPDLVGNLFRTASQRDRTCGPGGRLLGADGTTFHYDEEGNLLQKRTAAGQVWCYRWSNAGRLLAVARPDGYAVTFTYDALG